jgi:hypothetical protein
MALPNFAPSVLDKLNSHLVLTKSKPEELAQWTLSAANVAWSAQHTNSPTDSLVLGFLDERQPLPDNTRL